MATNNVIKEVEIKSSNNLSINKLLGAEAQNIDVSYDANGNIIEDITITPPTSVEPLSVTLKQTQGAVTWSEENILGAKNLIPIGESIAATDGNGIAYTVGADGSITLSGTATAESTYSVEFPNALNNEYKYTIDCATLSTAGVGVAAILRESDGTTNIAWFGASGETDGSKEIDIPENSDVSYFAIVVTNGASISNLVIKPMLRLASIKDRTYVPYAKTNLELTALVGKGGGHTILDGDDTEMPQRTKMKFYGSSHVEDDDVNGVTDIIIEPEVHKFTIAVADWEANTDPTTSAKYPYIAEIDSDLYSSSVQPTWQLYGMNDLPTDLEEENIDIIRYADFSSAGIVLFAEGEVTAPLRLWVAGTVAGSTTSGGGHAILDQSGNVLEQRGEMQFLDATPSDDSTHDITKIEIIKTCLKEDLVDLPDGVYKTTDEGEGSLTAENIGYTYGEEETVKDVLDAATAIHTFTVETTDWVANTDPDTSADYPYVAEISTDLYNNESKPVWQMNGVGEVPTSTERESINVILEAVFQNDKIILYATDQVASTLILEVGGSIKSYTPVTADGITYDNTGSGLVATDVQDAIDEVNAKILNPYINTGLSVISNRVNILGGGYRVNGSIIEVDITLEALTTINTSMGVVVGFPSSSSADGNIAYAYDFNMYKDANGVSITANTAIPAGSIIRFVTAYKKA